MPLVNVPPKHFARAYRSSGVQSINNNTATAIVLDGETADTTGSMHDNVTNASRLVVPDTGLYIITGNLYFPGASGGFRDGYVRIGGVTTIFSVRDGNPSATNGTILTVALLYQLTAGQYIELFAYQNTGVAANVGAGADLTWLALGSMG